MSIDFMQHKEVLFVEQKQASLTQNRGAIIIDFDNSHSRHGISLKPTDLFIFTGIETCKNYIDIVETTETDYEVTANEWADTILNSKWADLSLRSVYAGFYRVYLPKIIPLLKKYHGKYQDIRIYYNKMDDYIDAASLKVTATPSKVTIIKKSIKIKSS